MPYSDEPTHVLVDKWRRSLWMLEEAKKRLKECEEEVSICSEDLGHRLAPDDLVDGETIGIWVRISDDTEKLITVVRLRKSMNTNLYYKVEFRGSERKIKDAIG